MSSQAHVQAASPSGLVHLYDFDASLFGAGLLRFSPDAPNALGTAIIFNGNPYAPLAMEATGFDKNGNGAMPRPIVRISALGGVLTQLAMQHDDLLGLKLTRTRVFVAHLDAVNFANGNPQADPNQYLDKEIWFFERKSSETETMLEWELASPFDVQGVLLPRRQYIQGVCPWIYRGADCGWTGGAVADKNDNPTSDMARDRCSKSLQGCKMRFYNDLPFGGFPGTGRVS